MDDIISTLSEQKGVPQCMKTIVNLDPAGAVWIVKSNGAVIGWGLETNLVKLNVCKTTLQVHLQIKTKHFHKAWVDKTEESKAV